MYVALCLIVNQGESDSHSDEEKAGTSFILLDVEKVEKEKELVYDEKTREIING